MIIPETHLDLWQQQIERYGQVRLSPAYFSELIRRAKAYDALKPAATEPEQLELPMGGYRRQPVCVLAS